MNPDPVAALLYVRGLVPEDWSEPQILERAQRVRHSLSLLDQQLEQVDQEWEEQAVQSIYYEMGKIHFSEDLRWWFRLLYQCMFKSDEGPRMGQFTKLVGAYWVQERLRTVLTDPWSI